MPRWSTLVVTVHLLLLSLTLGGCQQAQELVSSVRGSGATADEAEPEAELDDTEAKLRLERQQAELARLEAERRERERVAAEDRRRELEQADALVERWAERLAAAKTQTSAFIPHQGLTEDDPWGGRIQIEYSVGPDPDSQTLEVRSAGPNGQFNDEDDLVRTRTTTIERSWWARNKWIAFGVFMWIGIGSVSAGGLRRRRIRQQPDKDSSLDAADVLLSIVHIVFAPLALFFWVVVGVLGIFEEL